MRTALSLAVMTALLLAMGTAATGTAHGAQRQPDTGGSPSLQIGSSAPSARILVFDRSLAVGSVPSIQMYSALYVIERRSSGRMSRPANGGEAVSRPFPTCCPYVNAL